MTITVGDMLPDATFLELGESGPREVRLADLTSGKVALFGVPGAFTGTCTKSHVPSFIATRAEFEAEGYSTIICVSVNDPFVMDAWAKDTGAQDAGLHMLADPEGSFIRAMGLGFDAPPAGLINRSKRFALAAEGGKITALHIEDNPGLCGTSAGDALLDAIK